MVPALQVGARPQDRASSVPAGVDSDSRTERASDAAALSVAAELADLRGNDLSTRDYARLSRAIRAAGGTPDVRMAFVGNFTFGALENRLVVHGAAEGLRLDTWLGSYGQYFQELADAAPSSPLREFDPDVIVLALSPGALRPVLGEFTTLSVEQRRLLGSEIVEHAAECVRTATERFRATVLVCNFPSPVRVEAGVADPEDEYGETEFYLELNLALLRRLKSLSRARLFDLQALASRFGTDRVRDSKMFYLARMEWSEAFLRPVAEELVRHAIAVQNRARKCLVLDLDNTLWGGVVGEDGVAGVRVGTGDPLSEAYRDFQLRIKSLQRRGVILALCSKNNPADALAVFEERDMPLKVSDFAGMQINWQDKHRNLEALARQLNIGLDSFVFCDDNPAEIDLVRQMLPEVKVLHLAGDPAGFVSLLDALPDFEKARIIAEDAAKTVQYRQNAERESLRTSTGDLEAYLHSLQTSVVIRDVEAADLPRIHQLFSKTNQFNLTTRRYSAGDLEDALRASDAELLCWQASDRFGDLGLIGVTLLRHGGTGLHIDSFLMSCRAMGRGIETAVMNHIKARFGRDAEPARINATYRPTVKNQPVSRFYDEQGFDLVEESAEGVRSYTLARERALVSPCDWIRVTA